MRYSFLVATAAATILAGGTAHADKTAVYNARFQAKYPGIAELGPVGVLNFNGREGEEFASILAASLQSAQLDGKPLLTVKMLDSMNYKSESNISKAEVAAAIRQGQKLGVKVVFTGTVTTAAVNSTNYVREERICAESVGFLKCKRYETNRIPCTKVIGQYAVTPRAIRVDSGAIVYSQTVSTTGEYSVCNGEVQGEQGTFFGLFGGKKQQVAQPTVATPDALLTMMRSDAAEQIRMHIAPYNRGIKVTFMDKPGTLTKPEQAQFKNALAFAGAGRLDRTCAIFETLFTGTNQTNIPLLYNMGACQEVMLPEDPSAALEYYAKADQMLSKPNKLISDAYMRTKALVGTERSLRK